jgi:DNA invertase Pin-like site-specific DNA recombinase
MVRSLIDLQNTIQILEKKGIEFISLQDSGIDTTSPNGKLLLQILGAFAEFERNLINQRTQAGKEGPAEGRKVWQTTGEPEEREVHRREAGYGAEAEGPECEGHCQGHGLFPHTNIENIKREK